jgi:hypothetical protein
VQRLWTIRRATGIGIMAGLAAFVLWPIYAAYQERVLWAFIAALGVAAFCGVSILLMTLADLALRQRGSSVRPVRAFDMLVGLLLAVPSLLELDALL